MSEEFIERRIVIGLIVSTEYTEQISSIWDPEYLESPELKMMAGWCLDYFEKYRTAPHKDIESIYTEQLQTGLDKDRAEFVELILTSLNDEFERQDQFNVQYLLDQTKRHFKQRHLVLYNEEIQALLDAGELEEAEKFAAEYRGLPDGLTPGLELSSREALKKIDGAFATTTQTIVKYPGALGELWNSQMVRGGFVALMGSEKRGKTWMLIDISMRAARGKFNVAFFQAGDMTEEQQLKRVCIYLAKRSDKEKYCGKMFLPVKDCWLNQIDECDRDDRDCDFGVLTEGVEQKDITYNDLIEASKASPDYGTCWKYNCPDYKGAVWYAPHEVKEPLTPKEAKKKLRRFFKQYRSRFKLSTHANGSLSVREMRNILSAWERQDGFIPDLIVVDYADLLIPDQRTDMFRHGQNEIWKALRGLSQDHHALVVTATQADAKSYEQGLLRLSNFSEDKRKYAHVTSMFGLNQDPHGKEKRLGLLRINELVVREDEFYTTRQVALMQKLQIGRPCLGSFWHS